MKKYFYKLAVLFVLTFTYQSTKANDKVITKTELSATEKAEISAISKRVEEIRSMDKSTLTRVERKELRKELKELKKRADFLDGKVTLSVGAIIIILLLLILIF